MQCPFCNSANAEASFARCKLGHVYCDDCALVHVIEAATEDGGDEACCGAAIFCPMCAPPPPEFVCPITHELMDRPVVAQDGFSYEQTAILEWMNHRKVSPKTNAPIDAVFVPNLNLRALISEWRLLHCGGSSAAAAAPPPQTP